jgi:hypothetical protein
MNIGTKFALQTVKKLYKKTVKASEQNFSAKGFF